MPVQKKKREPIEHNIRVKNAELWKQLQKVSRGMTWEQTLQKLIDAYEAQGQAQS